MTEKIELFGCQIMISEGDISLSDCDAIVNAANNHLWMGSGVAGAIKRRGGQIIEDEAVKLGPIEVGQAVATTSGSLKALHVIHGAVMGQDLCTDAEKIRFTTASCFAVAVELGARSIAFPAFGTGVGGFPIEECARIMLAETVRHLRENGTPQRVEFVLFGQAAYQIFATELSHVAEY